ncbi:hypothetical protein F442_23109 [Phytophthora nicotianae P10297]|uniref:Uncharacterized protein n=1 Tax=Phytophthora nicotianae P10297 TaxID=1317064 RepID=W2XXN9_PHYNI|nr:hypothetical protein F442_23109 [Phytophthora nicotianae P10297]
MQPAKHCENQDASGHELLTRATSANLSPPEHVRESGMLPTEVLNRKMPAVIELIALREPELTIPCWISKANVDTRNAELKIQQGIKRIMPDSFDIESPMNLQNWSENSVKWPMKKMKGPGCMSSQGKAGEELTALYPENLDSREYRLPKPWWSVEGEGYERVQGVTCWNSKWNVWVIDLVMDDLSDSGLTNAITSSSGMKEGFAQTKMTSEKAAQVETTMLGQAWPLEKPSTQNMSGGLKQ